MYALLLAQNPDEKAVLTLALQRAGLAVAKSNDLERALRLWSERPADLILFALPDDDPLTSVRRIRRETTVIVVAISEQMGEEAHYELLEAGADLLVTRPFSARLLIAQLRALLRRAGSVPLSSLPTLNLGGLILNPGTRTVQVSDHPPRHLTHLEFRLLYTLMVNRGQVLPTSDIVEHVWGYSGDGSKDLVRGLVRRLRLKVEPNPRRPRYVLTVPGLGYSFNQEE
jgi:DNA-binding response OmpR family regulator